MHGQGTNPPTLSGKQGTSTIRIYPSTNVLPKADRKRHHSADMARQSNNALPGIRYVPSFFYAYVNL